MSRFSCARRYWVCGSVFFGIGAILILCIASVVPWVRETKEAEELAPDRGRFVESDEGVLYIETQGDPTNSAVVLIHGMAAWSGTWRPTMQRLAEEGYYAISVDLPPFGFSQRPQEERYGRVAQARRLIALLDALAVDEATLVGHSFGGRATMETALRYEDRVRAVVLIDAALDGLASSTSTSSPTTGTYLVEALLASSPLRHVAVSLTFTNPLLSKWLLSQFVHQREAITDELVTLYQKPSRRIHSTRDLGRWLAFFVSGKDAGISQRPAAYKRHTMPTALIWGVEDTITPLSHAHALQALMPQATLYEMTDVGHIPHVEDEQQFLEILVRALQAQ